MDRVLNETHNKGKGLSRREFSKGFGLWLLGLGAGLTGVTGLVDFIASVSRRTEKWPATPLFTDAKSLFDTTTSLDSVKLNANLEKLTRDFWREKLASNISSASLYILYSQVGKPLDDMSITLNGTGIEVNSISSDGNNFKSNDLPQVLDRLKIVEASTNPLETVSFRVNWGFVAQGDSSQFSDYVDDLPIDPGQTDCHRSAIFYLNPVQDGGTDGKTYMTRGFVDQFKFSGELTIGRKIEMDFGANGEYLTTRQSDFGNHRERDDFDMSPKYYPLVSGWYNDQAKAAGR